MHSRNKGSAVWMETSRPPSKPSALGPRVASTGSLLGSSHPPKYFNLYDALFFLPLSFLADDNGIVMFPFEVFFSFYHLASANE